MMSLEEAGQRISQVMEEIEKGLSAKDWENGKLSAEYSALYNKYGVVKTLYTPNEKLIKRIDDYFAWRRKEVTEDAGQLLEEIAGLAFGCLLEWDDIESYQSYSAQHDLVISGSSDKWLKLMEYLHLPKSGRTIVVEAKNLKGTIEDKHFGRLCSIIEDKFAILCHLAVFISTNNASGFQYRRGLRDARATQVLFHARTKKFVVVITSDDFEKLKEDGGLPQLLEAKIRDVEIASNIQLEYGFEWTKINLPPHINRHFDNQY